MVIFPNPETADDVGLVAVGGDLQPETLIEAYTHGIFPYYDEEMPLCWWSPNPRAIFEFDRFHVSRRLARTMRSGRFQVTVNRAFTSVMRGCAEREEGTWILEDMIKAYTRMHQLGFAHSVEVWHEGKLAGGVYGVALGRFFAGESMFHRVTDASKVALAYLVAHLRQRGFELFDIQWINPHTASLGASEISRTEYLERLALALRRQ